MVEATFLSDLFVVIVKLLRVESTFTVNRSSAVFLGMGSDTLRHVIRYHLFVLQLSSPMHRVL